MNELKQLKRSRCSILNLELKGKWYHMIQSGEKKEEYREIKDHWRPRVAKWIYRTVPSDGIEMVDGLKHLVVAFSIGYKKKDMFFQVNGVTTSEDEDEARVEHPEWGEPDCPHYIIMLGERVELVE